MLTMNYSCVIIYFLKCNPKFSNSRSIWILEGCETWGRILLLQRMGTHVPLNSQASERIGILPRSVSKEASPTCCSSSFCVQATETLFLEAFPQWVFLLFWGAAQKNDPSQKKLKEKSLLEICPYTEHWWRKWAEIV